MPNDLHKCYRCGEIFETQRGINGHLRKPLGCAGSRAGNGSGASVPAVSSKHRCYLCGKTFVTQRGIDRHLRKSH